MKIEDMHTKIAELFKKYNIPLLTLNLPMGGLQSWAISTSKRLKLNEDDFAPKVTELFWTMSQVIISFGYTLIARQTCKFPKGTKGIVFKEKDIPIMISIPEMHFWHNIYSARECIYRYWERLTSVIKTACYPTSSEKFYFNTLVEKLKNDTKFKNNLKFKYVAAQVKHWNKAAKIRNKLSHKESSPFRTTEIRGELSSILNPVGEFFPKLVYSAPNLISEINKLEEDYLKLLPAVKAIKEFIDSIR